MTDPERISQRSSGLAAELLRAGADEQPRSAGIERTLAALGVSGAALGATSTASATAASAGAGAKVSGALGGGAAAGGAVKATTGLLLVKWVGIGVLGGASLAGAAAVVAPRLAGPASSVSAQPRGAAGARVSAKPPVRTAAAEPPVVAAAPSVPVVNDAVAAASAPASRSAAAAAVREAGPGPESEPEIEIGAPLAAEVALVDRARALLGAGQTEQGLALLNSYERDFPQPRLLPEVLFLRLETYQRAGRDAEARQVAQRLLDGFPRSPHAARARKVLGLP